MKLNLMSLNDIWRKIWYKEVEVDVTLKGGECGCGYIVFEDKDSLDKISSGTLTLNEYGNCDICEKVILIDERD